MNKFSHKTAFIIPVYNEASVIEDVIRQIGHQFEHIICVDDGSTDQSRHKIEKTKAYLIEHPINMGQGAALQTGIEFGRDLPGVEYFVTYDADGQHRLEDVLTMLDEISKDENDIILGSRFLGSSTGMTQVKRMVLKLAVWFSNATSGLKLTTPYLKWRNTKKLRRYNIKRMYNINVIP